MKKNILLGVSFIFAVFNSSFAQQTEKTIIKYSDTGTIKSVSFSREDKSVAIPQTHNEFFKEFLRISNDDEFRDYSLAKSEARHQSFVQYYKGVKVAGAGYTFHYDDDGIMRFAHGNYIEIADLDIIPKITPEEAKNIFAKHLKIDLQLVKDFKSELLIKCMNNKITGGNSNPLLVYCISLEANSINNTAIGYVNAHDGKIEDIEKTTCDINALALFDTRYYGTQYSITDNVNNEYRLYDGSRGAVIHTRKLNGMPYNTGVITEITDDDNYWHYTDFTNRGDMGLDVHWSLQKIYDRLYNVHGINSFNNNGVPIYAYANAGFEQNGFIINGNAAWDTFYNVLLFGRGDSFPRAFCTMDVIAHEYGHGISDFKNWWDDGRSRHLSEGLSDIWGVIMDYRFGENDSDPWKVGEKIFVSETTNCLRDIENPRSDSAYTKIADYYLSDDYINENDPYYRSGVFSHWFYKLVYGGSFEINGESYGFNGVGMDVAEELIVNTIYNGYLFLIFDYPYVRNAFIAAAQTMNVNGLEAAVRNAWYAVGVGEMTEVGLFVISGPTHPCDSTVYVINNLSSACTVEWDFQDSPSAISTLLSYSSANSHECIINNTSHAYFNDVLEAKIYNDGHHCATLKKRIRTGLSFTADMLNEFDNPPVVGGQIINRLWTVYDGDSIDIIDSGKITLTSGCFNGALMSYPATDLSNWDHFGNEISFNVTRGRRSKILAISGQKGCDHFKFHLIVPPIGLLPLEQLPELIISPSSPSNTVQIMLNWNSGQDEIFNFSEAEKGDVHLIVSNVTTGQILYNGLMTDNSVLFRTSEWRSGIYATKVITNDYILTKKFSIE